MYSCSIKNAWKYSYLADKFSAGLKWLSETDISSLPEGKTEIPGAGLIADVQIYETRPAEEGRFESHNENFDIQYVAEGREYFCVCPAEGLKVSEAHPERDLYFLDRPENYGSILLNAGDFVIVAPGEAHMSRCSVNAPEKVRKVIIKVKA